MSGRVTSRNLLPIANELDWTRAHRPKIQTFSRWRWATACIFGLRHRKGEDWFEVRQGAPMQRVSRCTRCGVKIPGRTSL